MVAWNNLKSPIKILNILLDMKWDGILKQKEYNAMENLSV